jgi:outer membrane protein TolC
LDRIDDLVDENRLLQQAVTARLAAAQMGNTMQLARDIVMPRQEAALIDERRDMLLAQRQQSIAMLKRWVGSAAAVPLEGAIPVWTITRELLTTGLHKHPDLEIFDPRARVLDAEVAEANAAKKPDWALEVGYQQRGSAYDDMLSLQVSVDLPLFPAMRQDPHIAAKRAERAALDAEREAVLREHTAMLEMELAEYQRITKAVTRQQNVLLPLTTEKVMLALTAWQNLQGSLMDLIEARRERIDAELQAIALEGERQQMAAQLYYTYGNHADPLKNATAEQHHTNTPTRQRGAQP